MTASSHHHPAVLVGDIDRAARFYLDAFAGRWLLHPVLLAGAAAEGVINGPPGAAFKVALIGLAEGCIELFELVGTAPDWAGQAATPSLIPHFGLQVDDTEAALARVEEAGGRRVWPKAITVGAARVVYVADPDDNIIELIDADIDAVVAALIERFPEAAPAA